MKTSSIWLLTTLLCIIISCKEKKQPLPLVEAPVVVEKDTLPEDEPVVEIKEEVKPIRHEVQNYFLIAGCFEYKENADKLCNKLQKEGYDSKIITYFENLYLVSYDGFPTRKEGLQALKEIRKEKGKEKTWLYKSEY
ncbi:SPOR domain-containing protein [Odoribacter lunatus]|uniref:SPOR domain-containing protein n=1 Tax=Odoribacter lunatus TaxID=2941335 RepID=UPI00203B69CD|nr:SPOR domain-containing protein [Odoribacter lunatus]